MKKITLFFSMFAMLAFCQQGFSQDEIIHDDSVYANIPFQGYTENSPAIAKLQYRIFYHKTNGIPQNFLSKPVIISDGFDPLDARKIQASDYLNPPYDKTKDKSIEDMMSYKDCSSGRDTSVLHQLTTLGYDVIIVNYPEYIYNGQNIDGGADYIERNAMGMIALIQKINNDLQLQNSTEQLVVIGPSMGGQITRYALAYMEKMYAQTGNVVWLHNTRLWVSIDSPHLGANIPLGAQSLVYQLIPYDNSHKAQNFYNNWLGSAAAKQQLIEYYNPTIINTAGLNVLGPPDSAMLNGRTVSQGYSLNHGSSFFQQFYNNTFSNGLPNSNGYPMNLRKIALVNGSLSGKKTVIVNNSDNSTTLGNYGNPSSQSINLRGFANIIGSDLVAAFEGYNMPTYNQSSEITRVKHFLDDNTYLVSNFNSRGSMDMVSGGYFPAWDVLTNTITGQSINAIEISNYWIFDLDFTINVNWDIDNNKRVHSFIPSYSALGIKNPDQDWSQPLNDRNLVCTNEIPFDSYFGHDDNTQHTSFDCQSVNWLLQELAGNSQVPWYPVNPDNLTGNEPVCVGSSEIFSFANCTIPSNVVSWDVSNNLQIASHTGSNITVVGLTNGTGTITSTFSNGNSVTKTIHVGLETGNIPILGLAANANVCAGTMFNVYTGVWGSYNWTVNGGHIISGQGTPEIYVQVNNTPNYGYYVGVAKINQCGLSGDLGAIGGSIVFCEGGGGGNITSIRGKQDSLNTIMSEYNNAIAVFPNPTQNNITITLSADSIDIPHTVILVKDAYGRTAKKVTTVSYYNTISLSNVASGVYFIDIYDGKKRIVKKIVKLK